MKTSIATVSLSGGLAEKMEAIAAAGFTGVEIFESDLLSFDGRPKDVARMARLAWLEDCYVPAVSRFRGDARTPAHPHLRARGAQVRSHGRTWLRPADDLQQLFRQSRREGSTAPRPTSENWASAHPSAAFASAMRRWPGAGISTTIAMPGRWFAARIIRPSELRWTAFTSWRARPTSVRSVRYRETRSRWSNWLMRRGSTWMSYRGAGTSAAFRGRAISRSRVHGCHARNRL